ncbi:sensor histidine kinase [Bacillus pumilus]|uniref:histidine kinase n=1 Tax=Bacillus pumilus TaxID=1408 RepID=A0A2G8IR97_BACPU|nr:HAMP domain-containing sensor histidine kinase [Bacillus pumilus]PIK25983.1 vancomycin resistance histidine kinase VanS [Bacillus pumilus]
MVKFMSFRMKMVLLFGLSMLLAGAVISSVFLVLRFYYQNYVQMGGFFHQVRLIIAAFGDYNLFLCLFIPLSILFFFLLTKRYALYFQEISQGIHQLAEGNFTHRVQIKSKDEFQAIAEDIHSAATTLKEAIERGDFAESSKDQLVVNLAHDLRTPLTSVLGYLDLILKGEYVTEEQMNHFLTIAFTKSQRLERLIDELFEITRMNYGMLPIKKSEIHLTDLLHQLKEELYPLIEQNQLSVRIHSTSDLMVMGDGDLLARVFENLMTNAIRYGNDGQYIDINGFTDENVKEIVIQVVNYGHVIHEGDLPHLFDMFYIGDKSRTYKENSTGLGLFIAKNIVEQHEGTITADSNRIQTTFEVRLPMEKKLYETS